MLDSNAFDDLLRRAGIGVKTAYRPDEAALILGVSKTTVYKMMGDGLKFYRVPGGRRIRHDELERYMEASECIHPHYQPFTDLS